MLIDYKKNRCIYALGIFATLIPMAAIHLIGRDKGDCTDKLYSSDAKVCHMGIALINLVIMNIGFTAVMYLLHKKGFIGCGTSMLISNSVLCFSLFMFVMIGGVSYNRTCYDHHESLPKATHDQVNTGNSVAFVKKTVTSGDDALDTDEKITTDAMITRKDMKGMIIDATLLGFPAFWPFVAITLFVDKCIVNPLSRLCHPNAEEQSRKEKKRVV